MNKTEELKTVIESVLQAGWPTARIEKKGVHTLAKIDGALVADIALWPNIPFAFFAYGYAGNRGDVSPLVAAEEFLGRFPRGVIKGGNPALIGNSEPPGFRELDYEKAFQIIDGVGEFVRAYVKKRFPDAEIEDICLYGGAAWCIASKGNEGLGLRDIDINVFFKPGAPRSLAWITRLEWKSRVVDLYWNTLKPGETPRSYIEKKSTKVKVGRWLTIPERPWISLVSGDIIWPGRMD